MLVASIRLVMAYFDHWHFMSNPIPIPCTLIILPPLCFIKVWCAVSVSTTGHVATFNSRAIEELQEVHIQRIWFTFDPWPCPTFGNSRFIEEPQSPHRSMVICYTSTTGQVQHSTLSNMTECSTVVNIHRAYKFDHWPGPIFNTRN